MVATSAKCSSRATFAPPSVPRTRPATWQQLSSSRGRAARARWRSSRGRICSRRQSDRLEAAWAGADPPNHRHQRTCTGDRRQFSFGWSPTQARRNVLRAVTPSGSLPGHAPAGCLGSGVKVHAGASSATPHVKSIASPSPELHSPQRLDNNRSIAGVSHHHLIRPTQRAVGCGVAPRTRDRRSSGGGDLLASSRRIPPRSTAGAGTRHRQLASASRRTLDAVEPAE
jgi:hypothetical protein